jgi:hypothetical protein
MGIFDFFPISGGVLTPKTPPLGAPLLVLRYIFEPLHLPLRYICLYEPSCMVIAANEKLILRYTGMIAVTNVLYYRVGLPRLVTSVLRPVINETTIRHFT